MGATYDHSVKTSRGEAGGANKSLSGLELGLVIGLDLDGSIGLGRTIVETLCNCVDGSDTAGSGGEDAGRTHFESVDCIRKIDLLLVVQGKKSKNVISDSGVELRPERRKKRKSSPVRRKMLGRMVVG